MARGAGHQELVQRAVAPRRFRPRPVHLFGGPADGWLIELDDYSDEISVYRRVGGGPGDLIAFAQAGANGHRGEYLGQYRLDGPRGPERPVYVFDRLRSL